jgi:chromosomal replication initiation ATPase DnaA
VIQPGLSMPLVVEGVAACYNTTPEALLKCTRGPQQDNEPREVAMYLSQELSAALLLEIADYFEKRGLLIIKTIQKIPLIGVL